MPAEKETRLHLVVADVGCRARDEQPARDDRGGLGIGVRQQQGELVTADPEWSVDRAQGARQQRAEAAQRLVAGGVAGAVVDLLELVEVDEHERRAVRRSAARARSADRAPPGRRGGCQGR